MKVLVQRVKNAEVRVEEGIIGRISKGLLVFLGIGRDDNEKDASYLASKLVNLRIFEDTEGKMNLSLRDVGGEVLVVSQFTLFANLKKGNRPSFAQAAEPSLAQRLYRYFIKELSDNGIRVSAGKFQEWMEVELINEGPVTIMLSSQKNA